MELAGVVFHHFAYATEQQLVFKERYYGYKNALAQWRALQTHKGSGELKGFFRWVSDNTIFDDAAFYLIDPIAKTEPATGRWRFDGLGRLPEPQRASAAKRPQIVVDGIFWQYLSSGIGRVWENLLREWVKSSFSDNIILLDRAGTAPRIPGVHYWTIAEHDYHQARHDSAYLEAVCRELDADLFVSTYYSTPDDDTVILLRLRHDSRVAWPPTHGARLEGKAPRHCSCFGPCHDLQQFRERS